MSGHAGARSVVKKIAITTVLGAVAFPFTQLLFTELPGQIATAGAFSGFVLLVQFLVDFENRLENVERQLARTSEDMKHTVQRGFANINTATRLYAKVDSAGLQTVSMTDLLQQAARIDQQAPNLVSTLAQSEIKRAATFLGGLADRKVNYEGEDQELLLGLTRSVQHTIDATSLPEVDASDHRFGNFWLSRLGRRYLDLQAEAIKRGVKIRRVFLVEPDAVLGNPDLQEICQMQAEVGIDVRLLYPSAVPPLIRGALFDFILFDNVLSYEVSTAHVEHGEPPMILNTWLRLDAARIKERINWYREIWTSAVSLPEAIPEYVPEDGDELVKEAGLEL